MNSILRITLAVSWWAFAQEERLTRSLISAERRPTLIRKEETVLIQGRVRDKETGEPLIGAVVRLQNSEKGSLTQLDGSFSLSLRPEEASPDAILSITYIGYEEKSLSLKELEAGGEVQLMPLGVSVKEILILSSVANSLLTPLNFTRLESKQILELRGSQELTESMRFSPSVYASREGGGWGDSRINIRGFEQENIAVQINGIPVNDMENSRVYWSNWLGLSEVLEEVQVQKGLGNARIVLPSIGGTLNLRTIPPQADRRFILTSEASNVYTSRLGLIYHSGMSSTGWAVTLAGNRAVGPGYIPGTDFSSWTYYLAISKQVGERHRFLLQGFGAPQWHYQRFRYLTWRDIDTLYRSPFHNYDYGYLDGQRYSNLRNFYHKPLVSLSHFWTLSDKVNLLSAAYASFGRGGGSGILNIRREWDSRQSTYSLPFRPDGLIDWEKVRQDNRSRPDTFIRANGDTLIGYAANLIHRNSINSHNWYGLVSALNLNIGRLEINSGIDLRYYVAYHYREITNLFGADFWIDTFDVRRGESMKVIIRDTARTLRHARITRVGDRVNYDYDSFIGWVGGFSEIKYQGGPLAATLVLAAANTTYQRRENFRYRPEERALLSPTIGIFSYTAKGGVGLRLLENSLLYVSGGYFTRPPFFQFVFINDRAGNEIAQNYDVEKVLQAEGGFRWQSSLFSAQLAAYWIRWKDKVLMSPPIPLPDGSFTQVRLNGLSALHRGIEVEMGAQPLSWLRVSFIGNIGDWRWEKDIFGIVRDNNQQIVDTIQLFVEGLRVGSAPQTQLGGILRLAPLPNLYLSLNYFYYDRFWAAFDPEGRTNPNDRAQPWRLPAYGLLDAAAGYEVAVSSEMRIRLFGNIHNLLNTRYIVTALDGPTHDRRTARFFYGFGRTWNIGLSFLW
ncbi:MAG: TonB-dependent receptor [Bacteroidia bacterium]|nr:TonB-dependent receptor [Bacteroidia bacterium]MDW8014708.1 TonB-dependent receptor [Bacteroidia bacterium]